jgi:CheY-like chemotaxis protein
MLGVIYCIGEYDMSYFSKRGGGRPHMLGVYEEGPPGSAFVMAVDDDKEIIEIYSRMARKTGMTYDGLFNPCDVMEALKVRCPDLMLLDLRMPYMDGAHVLRQVRSAGYTFPILIVTSAPISDIERLNYMEWGANEILDKPVTSDKFREIVGPYFQSAIDSAVTKRVI